ncbi:hypothetical protein VO56_02245 [Mycoplasmopsis gallinacea]|uniref:Uncharacterized protein n=1 Tax=Mycoplasmopsis gallinacea TaxID=29556 RepID=A0A0D5ZK50_9BACT|nr:hypothetical protein VO56_02245 [Mycoplasmopsis gallinacea]
MKVNKKELREVLRNWDVQNKTNKLKDEIIEKDELFPILESISYYQCARLWEINTKIELESSNEEFIELEWTEKVKQTIIKMTDFFVAQNENDLETMLYELWEKIEYSLEKKYLNLEEIENWKLIDLFEKAEYNLIFDFLKEFNKRFKQELINDIEKLKG